MRDHAGESGRALQMNDLGLPALAPNARQHGPSKVGRNDGGRRPFLRVIHINTLFYSNPNPDQHLISTILSNQRDQKLEWKPSG